MNKEKNIQKKEIRHENKNEKRAAATHFIINIILAFRS